MKGKKLLWAALAAAVFVSGCAMFRSKVAIKPQQEPPCDYSNSGCAPKR